MSLFDKFKNISEFSENEAYLGIVFGVTACDGEVDDDELDSLIIVISRSRLFAGYTEDQLVKNLNNFTLGAEKNGVDWLFQEANRLLSPDLKKAAFTTAIDLAFADGSVGEAEEAFLEATYKTLEIPEDFVAKALEVMEVRHSY
jgi:uncharacterized tellurite resistance protein B-like protein